MERLKLKMELVWLALQIYIGLVVTLHLGKSNFINWLSEVFK